MDYLYIILIGASLFILPQWGFLGWKVRNEKKKNTSLSQENCDLRSHRQRTDTGLAEIEERMDELNHEVKDLHAHLIKLHQDQISWITSSKELPDPSKMVLVLDKDKKERHGFLNQGNESWTLTSLGGTMGKVSLEKITHWKPIFHL